MAADRGFNTDFRDCLEGLTAAHARFLVVGAHALAALGAPRATGDLDVWVDCTRENAARVWEALSRFGAPVEALGVTREDFSTPGVVVQLGVPPRRIDIVTAITGVEFDEAWQGRTMIEVEGLTLPFLGRDAFVRNKRALGRLKDLADLESIGEPANPIERG
jgi:hypothetical protein